MPGAATAPATPALMRTLACWTCFPQPGTKTAASQPGWCSQSWRHAVKRDPPGIPDPPPHSNPASGRHSPPGSSTQKGCEPQKRGARHPTPTLPQEAGPLPKPPCRLETWLPKRMVTQWPDRCPTGRCWGGTDASSAHVTPQETSWDPTSPHGRPLPP